MSTLRANNLESLETGRVLEIDSLVENQEVGDIAGIRATSIAAMEAYSAPVGYVFSLNAGGRSGTFDVITGNFSTELEADTENGVYVGQADDPTANTKVLKRRMSNWLDFLWFGATGDGTTDESAQVQAAINLISFTGISKITSADNLVFRCNNISISDSVSFVGGYEFKRLDDVDVPAQGTIATSPNVYVFDLTTSKITVKFSGLTLDANQQAQTNTEPSGIFVRAGYITSSETYQSTRIIFDNVYYKNNCKLAIYVSTGSNSNNRTKVEIKNGTVFENGRPNTVDYDADFIRLLDRCDLFVDNSFFIFNETLTSGKYPLPAIRLTTAFNFGAEQGTTANINNSKFYGLGRPNETGDAIGVIDCYEESRNVVVENCYFQDCVKSAVRAKTSIQRFIVKNNVFVDCSGDYAININPTKNNVPPNQGQYLINGNIFKNCTGMITVISNISLTDPAYNLIISENIGDDINASDGSIYARRIKDVSVINNKIRNSNRTAIRLLECSGQIVNGNNIRDTGSQTTDLVINIENSFGDVEFISNIINNTTGRAIQITPSNTSPSVIASHNIINGCKDYGIIAIGGDFTGILFNGNSVMGVTDLDRAFFAPSTRDYLVVVANVTESANPIINSGGGVLSQAGNSWQMA